MNNMKTTQARIEVTCPCCDKVSFSNGFSSYYTCDCAHCDALLLVVKGEVSMFNESMRKNYEEYMQSDDYKKRFALI
jgi:phage FluMu protein Com